MNFVATMKQQFEDQQGKGDIGPALHAPRQVTHWSSVIVSVMSAVASHLTIGHLAIVFSIPTTCPPIPYKVKEVSSFII